MTAYNTRASLTESVGTAETAYEPGTSTNNTIPSVSVVMDDRK